jgi:hypothetical protein
MAIDFQTLIHLLMFVVALGAMYLSFLSDSM